MKNASETKNRIDIFISQNDWIVMNAIYAYFFPQQQPLTFSQYSG